MILPKKSYDYYNKKESINMDIPKFNTGWKWNWTARFLPHTVKIDEFHRNYIYKFLSTKTGNNTGGFVVCITKLGVREVSVCISVVILSLKTV